MIILLQIDIQALIVDTVIVKYTSFQQINHATYLFKVVSGYNFDYMGVNSNRLSISYFFAIFYVRQFFSFNNTLFYF